MDFLTALNNMSHRELYAAYNRAKRNGLVELSVYVKALADKKYAEIKDTPDTPTFVQDALETMNKFRDAANNQATPDNMLLILTSVSGKKV